MQNGGQANTDFKRVVVMNFVKDYSFAHASQPPLNGAFSSSVTSSTKGIFTPSALALA